MADLSRRPAESVQAASTSISRVLLVERLPLAPYGIPSFENAARKVADLAGAPALIHLWTSSHESGRAGLEDMARARDALAGTDVRVVTLTTDEGGALVRARRVLDELGLGQDAGYCDAHALDGMRVVMLEILGFFNRIPHPLTLLVDAKGQVCAVYLGLADPERMAADARTVASMNTKLKNLRKLEGGRWLTQGRRDFETLAEAMSFANHEELATTYKALAERRARAAAEAAAATGEDPDAQGH